MPSHANPMLSVDVIAVRMTDAGPVLGLGRRIFEPFLGELALPGVLMRAGEQVRDAAQRAVMTKLGIEAGTIRNITIGQVHDTPGRDERGPTVSISCLAVINPAAEGNATWMSFDEVPGLPFDHNTIIRSVRAWMHTLAWENPAVLRALLGSEFSTGQMITLEEGLGGDVRYPANLHRTMDRLPFLCRAGTTSGGAGRQQTRWRIRTAH